MGRFDVRYGRNGLYEFLSLADLVVALLPPAERDAVIYVALTDSEYVHFAWRQHPPDLRDLPFPMLAHVKRDLSSAPGLLHPEEGVCLRATYIVGPKGVICFVSVNDLSVGRNPGEVLRVPDGLQTNELWPCNWQKGDDVLHAV